MATMSDRVALSLEHELRVLEGVAEWFEDRDHFTEEHFQAMIDPDVELEDDANELDYLVEVPKALPVDEAVRTCAIGGVEHTVWKVMGADVRSYRESHAYASDENEIDPNGPVSVYGRVMGRLNRIAVTMFGDDPRILDIEDVTQQGMTDDEPFENMNAVIAAALREVRAARGGVQA